MSVDNYPRVLILGETFHTSSGGGITLSNLFKGWPSERIAAAHSGEYFYASPICNRYYRLGSLEDRWIWPLSYIVRQGKVSGPVREFYKPERGFGDGDPKTAPEEALPKKLLRRSFYVLLDFLGATELCRRLSLSPAFLRWAADFRPDVVYAWFSTLNQIRLTTQLIETLDLPVVIHLMDDWPSTAYRKGVFSPYLRWRMDMEFRALLSRSSLSLGISHKMCQAFEARYRRPFSSFHNPIELASWREISKKDWRASVPFRIMYRGRVGTSIGSSLLDICDAVYELYQEGHPLQLELFITSSDDNRTSLIFDRPGCVSVRPAIPYQDMPASLASADLLVLAYDFDPASIQFIRYSMPTKTSEYMASGVPVLVYAADDLAITDYARRDEWGYIVTERGIPGLKSAIIHLMENQILREQLGRRAQDLAIQNHDAIRVRDAFRNALVQAVSKSSKDARQPLPTK